MSLLAVAQKFTPVVSVRRYDAFGAYTTHATRCKFRNFSSDSKRKSAAYDRVGISLPVGASDAGQEDLLDGDAIELSPDSIFIVGKQSDNSSHVPVMQQVTSRIFEALYCNARISVYSPEVGVDATTGEVDLNFVAAPRYTDIPASIATAETFVTEPLYDVKDDFFLTVPGALVLNTGDTVGILNFADSSSVLDHDFYRILHPYVDSIGVKRYRLGVDQSGR